MHSYLRVLRHPQFRKLFLGQSASEFGDRAVVVALALFVTQRTGSATDLGIVLAAQTFPLVAFLLFGGVWADRLPRHRIIVVTDLSRAVLHGTLAVLIISGQVQIWELVAIEALYGVAQAFFVPALTGLLPQTVPEPLIQDAKALTETMSNIAFLGGPALATALVLGLGAGTAFAFDAATFLVSASFLSSVAPRTRGVAVAAGSVLHELRQGWHEVRSRSWVWVTISVFTGVMLCLYAQWYALAPVIARDVYGNTAIFGLVEGLEGVGAVIGGVFALRWRPRRPLRAGLMLILVWPVQVALFALGSPLAIVGIGAVASGFGFSLFIIWWETALAQHVAPAVLSRVSAWDWMGSLALLPVGYVVAGPLAATFGARTVLGAGSVIALGLLGVGLAHRPIRELRRGAGAVATEPGSDPTPQWVPATTPAAWAPQIGPVPGLAQLGVEPEPEPIERAQPDAPPAFALVGAGQSAAGEIDHR